jgi:hypothetical protein
MTDPGMSWWKRSRTRWRRTPRSPSTRTRSPTATCPSPRGPPGVAVVQDEGPGRAGRLRRIRAVGRGTTAPRWRLLAAQGTTPVCSPLRMLAREDMPHRTALPDLINRRARSSSALQAPLGSAIPSAHLVGELGDSGRVQRTNRDLPEEHVPGGLSRHDERALRTPVAEPAARRDEA